MQRRAKRSAVVAGGRLHIDFVEQTGARQLSVRAAIQRHSPRHRDFAQSRARAEMPADMKNRAIERRLKRCRDITMDLRNLVARLASQA